MHYSIVSASFMLLMVSFATGQGPASGPQPPITTAPLPSNPGGLTPPVVSLSLTFTPLPVSGTDSSVLQGPTNPITTGSMSTSSTADESSGPTSTSSPTSIPPSMSSTTSESTESSTSPSSSASPTSPAPSSGTSGSSAASGVTPSTTPSASATGAASALRCADLGGVAAAVLGAALLLL